MGRNEVPAQVADEGKEQISPRLPLSLIDRLKRTAERNRRTISAEVEIAVEEHLDKEEGKNKKR